MDKVSFSLPSSEYFPLNSRFCAIEIGDFPQKFTNFSSFDKTSLRIFHFLSEGNLLPNAGFEIKSPCGKRLLSD